MGDTILEKYEERKAELRPVNKISDETWLNFSSDSSKEKLKCRNRYIFN